MPVRDLLAWTALVHVVHGLLGLRGERCVGEGPVYRYTVAVFEQFELQGVFAIVVFSHAPWGFPELRKEEKERLVDNSVRRNEGLRDGSSLSRRERLGTVGRALLRASSSASDELIGGLCWLKWASILPCGGRPCGPSYVQNGVRLGWAESCSKWREARCWRGDCWLKWASILPCSGRPCGPSHVRSGVRPDALYVLTYGGSGHATGGPLPVPGPSLSVFRPKQRPDSVIWQWSPDGEFTMKSTYKILSDGARGTTE
uniref:Uncharacterized protein n=1 Tax=Ananas comosus var. bracteatus TaxID=296719 RepID=A0A6V7NS29_ANACO|nr:unnamed protein product [Ananas comosus var. bracteatus]